MQQTCALLKDLCCAALAIALVGHKRVAEGLPLRHAQEAAAIQGVVEAADQGDAALQGVHLCTQSERRRWCNASFSMLQADHALRQADAEACA